METGKRSGEPEWPPPEEAKDVVRERRGKPGDSGILEARGRKERRKTRVSTGSQSLV